MTKKSKPEGKVIALINDATNQEISKCMKDAKVKSCTYTTEVTRTVDKKGGVSFKCTTRGLFEKEKEEKEVDKSNRLKLGNLIASDENKKILSESMERHAGEFYKSIDLMQTVSDEVFTDKLGYRKLDLKDKDDNVRKSMEDYSHGRGKYGKTTDDYYFSLKGRDGEEKVLNHPNQEAINRHNSKKGTKEIEERKDTTKPISKDPICPLYFFGDVDNKVENTAPKLSVTTEPTYTNMSNDNSFSTFMNVMGNMFDAYRNMYMPQ